MFDILAALAATLVSNPAPLDAAPQTRLESDLRCLLGAYSISEKDAVTITGFDGAPRGLQYTLSNGQFGKLSEGADGVYKDGALSIQFGSCGSGAIQLQQGVTLQQGKSLRLIEKQTSFMSDGNSLHGKLVLPADGTAKAMAVWIEGSNNDPSTDDTVWQYELARRGIAVFVYDKRGTGASTGAPTADFHARARDTAAAAKEARRLAPRVRKVGVIGGSQGGWVAPLTATLTNLDFVIPAFALAEGVVGQDKALVELQLRQAGFGEAELAEARKLTGITERIVLADMAKADAALQQLDAFKAQHADAAWMKAIQPRSHTGLFLMFPSEQIKAVGPALAQGLSFDYDPRPLIETIKPRQLWLLAGKDQQAPNTGTKAILRDVQKKRASINVVIFPNADHGMIERTGTETAYSAKLFDVTADWIKDGKLPAKGNFITMPTTN